MSDISSVLNTARQAILSELTAINTTGSNIANVNTPNYSRLRPVFSTVGAGTGSERSQAGVEISNIERVYNKYLDTQLIEQQQNIGYYDTLKGALDRVEATINESSVGGLSDLMSKFWGAWNDLAANPGGTVERDVLVTISQNLASTFSQVSEELTNIRLDMDASIADTITNLNSYTTDIASLNAQVTQIEVDGGMANDLRDRRTDLLNKVSTAVNIQFYESADGAMNVFLANGKPLVQGDTSWDLDTVANADNSNFGDIVFSGETESVSGSITGGSLGAFLEMRDTDIVNYLTKLNAIAENLVKKVNAQHQLGYDAEGNAGGNFFDPVATAALMQVSDTIVADPHKIAASATVNGDGDNASAIGAIQDEQMYAATGAVSATDAAPAATAAIIAGHEAQFSQNDSIVLTRGADAATWTVTTHAQYPNMAIVAANATTVTLDLDTTQPGGADLTLTLSGAWEEDDTAAFAITTVGPAVGAVTAADDDAAASQDHSATAAISDSTEVYKATSAAIGLKRGATAGTWTVSNDGGYTGLTVLSANASQVVLDLNGSGDAAVTLTLGGTWEQNDTLSFSLALDTSGSTLSSYYSALTGQIGQDSADAGRNQEQQLAVSNQLQAQRESVSGVAIDEEMLNLMKYQAAYNAAGKLSNVVNEMLDVLMNMVQ